MSRHQRFALEVALAWAPIGLLLLHAGVPLAGVAVVGVTVALLASLATHVIGYARD